MHDPHTHTPTEIQAVRQAAERVQGIVSTWHGDPVYISLPNAPKQVMTAWAKDLSSLARFALAQIEQLNEAVELLRAMLCAADCECKTCLATQAFLQQFNAPPAETKGGGRGDDTR